MIKYLILSGLSITIMYGQIVNIPYDWGGQYGVLSNNGRIMWNQDWKTGHLLIDGTFSNYPVRFGTAYLNNFKLLQTGQTNFTNYNFPDSSEIISRINYARGDFSFDQLEIGAKFSETQRNISINAFKRSYNGAYGQYNNPDGNSPLQQSYRLDYSSVTGNQAVGISVGRFLTDSRLNFNDSLDFEHEEKSVAAGLSYNNRFADWDYELHGALFQQYYEMTYAKSNNNLEAYLNRGHIAQKIQKKINNLDRLTVGISFDNQHIALVDSTKKKRSWSTIYSGWNRSNFGVNIGGTLAKEEVNPYFKIWKKSLISNKFNWNSYLLYEALPQHIVSWNFTNDSVSRKFMEKWFTAHADVAYNYGNIPIKLNLDWRNLDEVASTASGENDSSAEELSDNLISGALTLQFPIFRDWQFEAMFRHTFEHNLYSDGIGDKIDIGLIFKENLFKNNLLANLRIWCEGYYNHNSVINYQGFHHGPSYNTNSITQLADYWVFNMELSTKISQMTISWQVKNILQTINSINDQIFTNIDDKYLLINNNHNFPPLNRFVALNIIWDFKN